MIVEEDIQESIDFIELLYSTIVEAFSALDLYTDAIILYQLYDDNHQWWSTYMLVLLISPYLVSHGALVVILQKKLSFNDEGVSCCKNAVLSMTVPLHIQMP